MKLKIYKYTEHGTYYFEDPHSKKLVSFDDHINYKAEKYECEFVKEINLEKEVDPINPVDILNKIKIPSRNETQQNIENNFMYDILKHREEILKAFIAKYGYGPDEIELCHSPNKFWIQTKEGVKKREPLIVDPKKVTCPLFEIPINYAYCEICKTPCENKVNLKMCAGMPHGSCKGTQICESNRSCFQPV